MSLRVLAFLLLFVPFAWPQSQPEYPGSKRNLDGKVWLSSSREKRLGMIDGLADCMTWKARKSGFNATPEELLNKIDGYYRDHQGAVDLNVIDVWRQLTPQDAANTSDIGEKWSNPHWYLDGFWWRAASEDEQIGFLRGYLWCMHTQVASSDETYSRPISFYKERIDAVVRSKGTSKANREAVARTLLQYRDRSSPRTSK